MWHLSAHVAASLDYSRFGFGLASTSESTQSDLVNGLGSRHGTLLTSTLAGPPVEDGRATTRIRVLEKTSK